MPDTMDNNTKAHIKQAMAHMATQGVSPLDLVYAVEGARNIKVAFPAAAAGAAAAGAGSAGAAGATGAGIGAALLGLGSGVGSAVGSIMEGTGEILQGLDPLMQAGVDLAKRAPDVAGAATIGTGILGGAGLGYLMYYLQRNRKAMRREIARIRYKNLIAEYNRALHVLNKNKNKGKIVGTEINLG